MTTKKLQIREDHCVDISLFEGELTAIQDRIAELIHQHGPTSRVSICAIREYDDDVSVECELTSWREETDEEYRVRVARNRLAAKQREIAMQSEQEAKEAIERAELKRLLQKYGDISSNQETFV